MCKGSACVGLDLFEIKQLRNRRCDVHLTSLARCVDGAFKNLFGLPREDNERMLQFTFVVKIEQIVTITSRFSNSGFYIFFPPFLDLQIPIFLVLCRFIPYAWS